MVTIKHKPAARAGESPGRQGYFLPMSTPGAILAGVAGIHGDILTSSVFSFISKIGRKLSPTSVQNRFCKTMRMHHLIDRQVFNSNDTESIYDLPAGLVGKVRTLIGYALMDMRHHFTNFTPLGSAFPLFREIPLRFSQHLFACPEEVGVRNRFTIGQSGKGFKSDIDTDSFFRFWKRAILNLTGKGYKPLASRSPSNAAGFRDTASRATNFSLDSSYFRKINSIFIDSKSHLGIGKAVIPTCATEAWVTRLFSRLHPSKEGFEGKVYSHSYILKHLAVHCLQRGAFLLKARKGVNLVIHGKRFLSLFPCGLSLPQEMVVQPATLIENLLHSRCLLFRRVYTIFIGYLMHNIIITQLKDRSKPDRAWPSLSPALKSGVLDSVFR